MLLHQFILVLSAWARRFDSLLLHGLAVARRMASRFKINSSDLQET